MSRLYVWRPSAALADRAETRFIGMLDDQRSRYTAVFQRDFRIMARSVGSTWVGHLSVDDCVEGWSPWIDNGDRGVAWSGVCEEFLGRADLRAVATDAAHVVLDRPLAAAEWQGAFAVAAWDEDRGNVTVLTSATQPRPLWRTAGPAGWAVGSTARPLLALVGRAPELDEAQASLMLSFGYLAGDGSLFEGVDRVPARRTIGLGPDGQSHERVYISIPEFLERGNTRELAFADTVAVSAERLRQRVARQLRHSRDPMLSLTGGRDSRCIAAALHANGYRGPAQTGGAADTPDVVGAARVARKLGFEHEHGGDERDMLAMMIEHADRARAWIELTEGIETIRHALHFPRFFRDPGSLRDEVRQTFNGLTPGLMVRSDNQWGRAAAVDRIEPALHASAAAKRQMHEIVERLDRDLAETGRDEEDWPELFFWQSRAERWGQDNAAAKFGLTWWWTPLMDAAFIRASWWLPREAKRSKRFVESVTAHLAPELAGVPYDKMPLGPLEAWLKRFRRRVSSQLGTFGTHQDQTVSERRRHWERLLFGRQPRVWPELIEEAHLVRVLDANPNAHLLWSIATVELFAEAHLRGGAAGSVTSPADTRSTSDRIRPE